MQQNFTRKSLSIVALAVAVGFIEVAVSVACPAVPSEAFATPTSLEESIRRSVRGKMGQEFLTRLSNRFSGVQDFHGPHFDHSHPCVIAARQVQRFGSMQRMAAPKRYIGNKQQPASSPRSERAPPASSLS